jgi:hypothetical protein
MDFVQEVNTDGEAAPASKRTRAVGATPTDDSSGSSMSWELGFHPSYAAEQELTK